MTIAINNAFVSTIPDDPAATAAGKVTPTRWNAALATSMATGKIVGRTSAGTGPFEELSIASLQSPWLGTIDGAGNHTKNATMFDNGLNGTIGKSVDPVLHVLWSCDNGTGTGTASVPVFDFTGNGGGGTITTGSRLVYDRGENNFAFMVPLADHNYNISIDTGLRFLYDASQIGVMTWDNQGVNISFNISTGYSFGAGADETYISKGYFNLNYATGVGGNAPCLGTTGSGEVYANSSPALDGSNFSNISTSAISGLATVATTGNASDLSGLATIATSGSYNDLSSAPINASGQLLTNINANSQSINMSGAAINDANMVNANIASVTWGGNSPVPDGTYTVGLGLTSNGYITTVNGGITAIQEAS